MRERTFEELAKDEQGTIYHDEMDEGIRFIVLRGPASLCAYMGIPKNHVLAEIDKDNLPISAHGGLTYSGGGVMGIEGEKLFWFGWDYAHAGDVIFYDLDRSISFDRKDTKWTVKKVVGDSWEALYDMKSLMKLSKKIYNKVKKEGT